MKVGFIGLGTMGKPMVRNLMKAGHEVVVFNRSQPAIDQMVSEGATRGTSYAHVGAECPVVITMVPNAPDVKAVLFGESGVLSAAKPGTIVIDMSSIAPAESRNICEACAAKGVRMMDAPVSGGESGAVAGTLSIMCGGDRALFDECRELLSAMGRNIVYCGEIGAGNTVKLVNQIIVAGNMAVMAEGLMLARSAGVDPETAFQAVRGGLAGSAIMEAKAPKMLSGEYSPTFTVDLHTKDLTNAVEAGHSFGSPLPVTAQVFEMYQQLRAQGLGKLDHSSLAKFYERLAGREISG